MNPKTLSSLANSLSSPIRSNSCKGHQYFGGIYILIELEQTNFVELLYERGKLNGICEHYILIEQCMSVNKKVSKSILYCANIVPWYQLFTGVSDLCRVLACPYYR